MIKAGILTLVTRLRDVFLCVFFAFAPAELWLFFHGPLKELNLFFQSDTNIYSLVLVVCAGPTTITVRTAAVFFQEKSNNWCCTL